MHMQKRMHAYTHTYTHTHRQTRVGGDVQVVLVRPSLEAKSPDCLAVCQLLFLHLSSLGQLLQRRAEVRVQEAEPETDGCQYRQGRRWSGRGGGASVGSLAPDCPESIQEMFEEGKQLLNWTFKRHSTPLETERDTRKSLSNSEKYTYLVCWLFAFSVEGSANLSG